MEKSVSGRLALLALALAVGAMAGCSTGPGGFTLFPSGHRLLESAKAVRDASSVPADLPRELNKGLAAPWVVEPGDVLLVQPVNLDSPVRLPGDQTVLPDGSIQLGPYGRYVAAGKTIEQIETEVNALVRGEAKDAGPITARLVSRDSKVYYVLGEVNAPGAFQLKGRETVLDALIAAGGLTTAASRRNIILSRPTPPNGCRIVLAVCYPQIVQLGDTSTNYQIKAGDRVYVPTRTFREQLGHSNKECGPCGGMQSACPLPRDHAPAPSVPVVAPPASLASPVTTLPAPLLQP